uniref:Ribonuclease P n=1 Tax=Steinernema glaseri TaxID=37863 RepID=A0A1I7Y250_9BILA
MFLSPSMPDPLICACDDITFAMSSSPSFITLRRNPIKADVQKRLQRIERAGGVSAQNLYGTITVRRACATKSLMLYFNLLAALEQGHINWRQVSANHKALKKLRTYAKQGFFQMIATLRVTLGNATILKEGSSEEDKRRLYHHKRRGKLYENQDEYDDEDGNRNVGMDGDENMDKDETMDVEDGADEGEENLGEENELDENGELKQLPVTVLLSFRFQ